MEENPNWTLEDGDAENEAEFVTTNLDCCMVYVFHHCEKLGRLTSSSTSTNHFSFAVSDTGTFRTMCKPSQKNRRYVKDFS